MDKEIVKWQLLGKICNTCIYASDLTKQCWNNEHNDSIRTMKPLPVNGGCKYHEPMTRMEGRSDY